MSPAIRLQAGDGVATLLLDQPPANAMDAGTADDLERAVAELAADDDVRAVVVTGGRRVFSVGADLDEFRTLSAGEAAAAARRSGAAFAALAALPKPTVAAICGYGLGGGFELALCCDRRVAAETALVGLPEVRLGLIPGAGGTQRLARLAGPARAKDLVMTGRIVAGPEALALGIVDAVVPAGDVEGDARAWAAQFLDASPAAVAAAKQAVTAAAELPLADGLELEAELWSSLVVDIDASRSLATLGRAP